MAHTIEVPGVSDELLERLEAARAEGGFTDVAAYVRHLIHRAVLTGASDQELDRAGLSLMEELRLIAAPIHDSLRAKGVTAEQIEADVDEVFAEMKAERRAAREAARQAAEAAEAAA